MKRWVFGIAACITAASALDFQALKQRDAASAQIDIDSKQAVEKGRKTARKAWEEHREYMKAHPEKSLFSASSSYSAPQNTTFEVVLKCRSYFTIKHISVFKKADKYGSGLKQWAKKNGDALCKRYAPKGFSSYDGVYNIKRK